LSDGKVKQELSNRIRILVISLCNTFPFAVHLEQQQIIGKIDAVSPAFFEHADDSECFFECNDIDASLKMIAAGDGIDIVIKLFDRAMLELVIQITEQHGLIDKQLTRIFAVAFGNAFHKLHCGFLNGFVLF
jgi:hypothetical protein